MITSSFDYSLGVLNTTFANFIQINDMLTYFDDVKRNVEYPRRLKVLLHADSAELGFSDRDLKQIAIANKELLGVYECLWIAFIVDKPNETALSFMYKQLSEIDNLRFSVFSTTEIATKWLDHLF